MVMSYMSTFWKVPCAYLILTFFLVAPTHALTKLHGVADVETDIDWKVNPCDNFYKFACGGWLNRTELPKQQSRWTRGFTVVKEHLSHHLRDILEEGMGKQDMQWKTHEQPDVDLIRARGIYASCMNMTHRNMEGASQLQEWLDYVEEKVVDMTTLAEVLGKFHQAEMDVFFHVGLSTDKGRPGVKVLQIGQMSASHVDEEGGPYSELKDEDLDDDALVVDEDWEEWEDLALRDMGIDLGMDDDTVRDFGDLSDEEIESAQNKNAVRSPSTTTNRPKGYTESPKFHLNTHTKKSSHKHHTKPTNVTEPLVSVSSNGSVPLKTESQGNTTGSSGSGGKELTVREASLRHMARLLGLAGVRGLNVSQVRTMDRMLMVLGESKTALRDPHKTRNTMRMDELEESFPDFEWSTFFKNVGINASRDFVSVNVVSLPYLRNITGLIAKTPIKKLKAYLKWHLVSSTSSFLSQPFLDEEFRHWGKTMAGREEPSPLWQDCVNAVTTLQPDAVGKEFVRRHFAGNSHELASEMLSLVVDRMTALLRGVHWMDEHTKEKALKKVSNMHLKVGFPSEWHSLEFEVTDSWFANNMLARTTDFRESIGKILHPVDKDKWSSPCSTVNAFYSPTNNGIVIPAGILQPPFFDHDFPMPMNFGAIGIVMGHEVTHGFDDKGRKFDPTGKLENWWPDDVSKEFDHRTHCVRDLYSGFKVQKDLNVNGNLTLGENIADMGGVKLAFAAYEEWASKTQPKHGRPFRQMRGALLPEDEKSPIQKAPSSVTPRLTNDQLFFVSFAQTWCTVRTEQSERTQVKTNVHSPAKFRVNGPLADFEPFAEAFNCPVGSRMRRPAKDRCDVW